MVNRAIDTLTPIIAKASTSADAHHALLNRLWEAVSRDDIPYLEHVRDVWGELCATPPTASKWADHLSPELIELWEHCARTGEFGYSKTAPACMSALYAAGRHDELLALIAKSEYKHTSWTYRIWGARALAGAGKTEEAIRYAEQSKGLYTHPAAIASFCEGVLLDAGFADQAYARYAIEATCTTTNLATFRAIVKKYPTLPRETILLDLGASRPGEEGKWFAAAKDAGLYELAIDLANSSPSDPRTLIRAARDFGETQPEFAFAAGMTALRGIANGWGYEITNIDVMDAYLAITTTATAAGVDHATWMAQLRSLIAAGPAGDFVEQVLSRQLAL